MGFENSTILMEYIDGGPMANRPCISVQQCRGLAKWLHGFHAIFPGMKRGDAILRNFLEKDGDIYGIDFEEAGPGDQLEDVSMLCASILTEDPIFSREKGRCTRALIETYSELREEDLYGPCINLIRGDLFAIFNRWKAYRGRIDEDLLQWIGFYQTVI
jgi:aminoglycoside phosphotransferase (APT) family kinase protein